MKKLLFISAIIFQVKLFGQAVPNGNFETWNSVPYSDPTGWTTGNARDLQRVGVPCVTQVSGFSVFGIRIQTNVANGDTSESYIINTSNPCDDPVNWKGGVPYTQQPTAVTGYFRYNLPGNDTAIFFIIFRRNGAHIGDNFIKIKGTGSQNTWAPFTYTLSCSNVPDTVIIAAASSNKKGNTAAQNGSFLELDNLAFSGTTMQIPNGGFENWTAKNYDLPFGWQGSGDGVSRSASPFSGAYALRLETIGRCQNADASRATTGHFAPNSGPKGGRPYANLMDTLSGYYKYSSMGNDTALITVTLTKNSNMIGGSTKKLKAQALFTYFEIPFSVGTAPDSIRVDIQSSNQQAIGANAGSLLHIDYLQIKSQPVGLLDHQFNYLLSVYPNPSNGIFNLAYHSASQQPVSLEIYNGMGKLVLQNIITSAGVNQIDLSSFGKGLYLVKTEQNGAALTKRILVE